MERRAATDRSARFDQRLERIGQDRALGQRRHQLGAILGWGGACVLVALLGGLVAGPVAGLVGALGVVGLRFGQRAALRLAARRGASAWDWQANRYRLIGQPANRVHELDQPREQPGRAGRRPAAP